MAWSAAWAGLLFGGLAWAGLLRVSPEDEQRGMDFRKHGESAYPNMVNYISSQYLFNLPGAPGRVREGDGEV